MEARIVFIEGPDKGKSVLLKKNEACLIGRGGNSDVVLVDQLISREHLRVHFDGKTILLTDLGSTNRTFVTGRPLPADATITLRDDHFFVGPDSCVQVEILSNDIKGSQATPRKKVDRPSDSDSPKPRHQVDPSDQPDSDVHSRWISPGAGNFSVSVLPPHQQPVPGSDDSVIAESSLSSDYLQYRGGGELDQSIPELEDDSFVYTPPENPGNIPEPEISGEPSGPYMSSIAAPWEQGGKRSDQSNGPNSGKLDIGSDQDVAKFPRSPTNDSEAGLSNFDLSAAPDEIAANQNSSFAESVMGSAVGIGPSVEPTQSPQSHDASIASPDQYHSRSRDVSSHEPVAERVPDHAGNIVVERLANGLYLQSSQAFDSLESILQQLDSSYCVLLCLDSLRLGEPTSEEPPSGESSAVDESGNTIGNSNFEDSIIDNPVATPAIPSQRLKGVPLFDWIPDEADYRGPQLLTLEEFEWALPEVWQLDALCIFIGRDQEKLLEHLRHLRKLNFINGKQTDQLFGFCWPSIIHGVLTSQSAEVVHRILGDSLTAVLLEDPTGVFAWRLISRDLMLKAEQSMASSHS